MIEPNRKNDIERSMRKIKITKSKFVIVDDCDYKYLMERKWQFSNGYAIRSDIIYRNKKRLRKNITMHRLILSVPSHLFVDHINGNKLDNRRCNLRICTHSQNCRNQKKQKNKSSSRYKGVTWVKLSKKWRARIRINNKLIDLGLYLSEKNAALAYNRGSKKYHGKYARLNSAK